CAPAMRERRSSPSALSAAGAGSIGSGRFTAAGGTRLLSRIPMLALPTRSGNNFRVLRRIHVPLVRLGEIVLDPAEAHHIRDVLRVPSGSEVELFDDGGAVAKAFISTAGETVVARVETIEASTKSEIEVIVFA